MLNQEQLQQQIRAYLEQGPPPEPSEAHPGRFMALMRKYVEAYDKEHGRPPSCMECLSRLIHVLDHKAWEEELHRYRQLLDMVQQLAAKSRVQTPCPSL